MTKATGHSPMWCLLDEARSILMTELHGNGEKEIRQTPHLLEMRRLVGRIDRELAKPEMPPLTAAAMAGIRAVCADAGAMVEERESTEHTASMPAHDKLVHRGIDYLRKLGAWRDGGKP